MSRSEHGGTAAEVIGRVGLIVHFSTSNYGNHLVNFAAARAIEQCGYEVELIHFRDSTPRSIWSSLRRLPRKLRRLGFRTALHRLYGRLKRRLPGAAHHPQHPAVELERQRRFREFSDAHLRPREVPVDRRHELGSEYDRFVIGSDQIWNYDYRLGPWNFADFAAPDRVLPLSPSVGHDDIPLEWRPFYIAQLERFHEVGTRELQWTRSIARASERPRFSLSIDPTLALAREDWASLASDTGIARGKLLVYVLGGLSAEHEAFIGEAASLHGLGSIRLSAAEGGPQWASDAADFLGMIAESAGVITDSYHGAIFAFLFDKPLTIIPRRGFADAMNSRIETLAELCRLEGRFISRLTPASALTHCYADGHAALHGLREEFWAYLSRNGFTRRNSERKG